MVSRSGAAQFGQDREAVNWKAGPVKAAMRTRYKKLFFVSESNIKECFMLK